MIVGSSVHNQRIERLWKDTFSSVISYYYCLFYSLEEIGILNAFDNEHLAALHYVYIPRINQSLEVFVNGSSYQVSKRTLTCTNVYIRDVISQKQRYSCT